MARVPKFIVAIALTTTACGQSSPRQASEAPAPPATLPDSPPPQAPSRDDSGRAEISPALEASTQSIQQDLIQPYCASCHSEATSDRPDLSDITKLMPPYAQPPLIQPGCPEESSFFTALQTGIMPPKPSPRLSEETLVTVANWIRLLSPEGAAACISNSLVPAPPSAFFAVP